MVEDDNELSLDKDEEVLMEPAAAAAAGVLDMDTVKLASTPEASTKADDILETAFDAAEWNLDPERAPTQHKVASRMDKKQWRIRLDHMHQHNNTIKSLMGEAKSYSARLQEELSKALEKVSSKERNISEKLEPLIQEYLSVRARLHKERERHQQVNAKVMEKRQELREMSVEVMKIKQEMKDREGSMSAGAPVVRIRHSVTRLKQEVVQMDRRIGVVQHSLLGVTLMEESIHDASKHGGAEGRFYL